MAIVRDGKRKRKKLHMSLLMFLVCLLFTVIIWDHYFNSDSPFFAFWAYAVVIVPRIITSTICKLFLTIDQFYRTDSNLGFDNRFLVFLASVIPNRF